MPMRTEDEIDLYQLNKSAFFAALLAANISEVVISFDGEGDSGQIEDIVSYKDGEVSTLPTVNVERRYGCNDQKLEMPLLDAIEALCYDYLSDEHGGWENNDGGYGDFTFHVADRSIKLDIGLRYTDTTHHSHTF